MESFTSNNTNISCPLSLAWTQSGIDYQQSILYVCIIASIIHTGFSLQLIFWSSLRQKSIQWIYAYLITDILLLIRFFFIYIVHTTSHDCVPNSVWATFIFYFEATVDNYLNVLQVYILLALNICRYLQIAYNRNVYTTDVQLLVLVHTAIYLLPLIILIVQFLTGWAHLEHYVDDYCDVSYTNIYVQIFNIIIGCAVPIALNVLMIYASVRHVRLTSVLGRTQHHVSAREKYNRSLAIQFLFFYLIWLSLWSPNVIVYQLSIAWINLLTIVRLLNFILIALDPIIIGALDARFRRTWRKIWLHLKKEYLKCLQLQQRQIRPIVTNPGTARAHEQQETRL